jgi:hypothetical protein
MHLSEHKESHTVVKPPETGAGAPEQEIEITPEMIEAGIKEFLLCEAHDPPASTVKSIYLAMERLRNAS